MKRIFQRIDRIRGSGRATLNLKPDSPYFRYNGQRFRVAHIEKPDIQSKVTILIEGNEVVFSITEIL